MRGERSFDILAVGDPTFDIVFAVAQVPGAGDKTLGRRIGSFAGGTAANAACAAARLGGRIGMFGRIGNDSEGRFMVEDFRTFGVSTHYLAVDPRASSACAMIMIDPRGEKALVYAPMPVATLDKALLKKALADSRAVYTMPYDLGNFTVISSLALQEGTKVTIDIEPSMLSEPERFAELISLSDIVFMNEAGFRAGTGESPTLPAVQAMLALGPEAIVVTRGAQGAIGATEAGVAAIPAFPCKAVDTTGAGDCFNGAFLTAYLDGKSLEDALRFAAAAAACVVSVVGARTGIPDRPRVETMISWAG